MRDKNNWFPRTDTDTNKVYNKRKPGLFKLEYEGTGMTSICSKTCYCWGSKNKFSSKGMQQNINFENFEY